MMENEMNQGHNIRSLVSHRVAKWTICVLNRVRVWRALPKPPWVPPGELSNRWFSIWWWFYSFPTFVPTETLEHLENRGKNTRKSADAVAVACSRRSDSGVRQKGRGREKNKEEKRERGSAKRCEKKKKTLHYPNAWKRLPLPSLQVLKGSECSHFSTTSKCVHGSITHGVRVQIPRISILFTLQRSAGPPIKKNCEIPSQNGSSLKRQPKILAVECDRYA